MKIMSYIRDSFQEFEGYQSLVLFSQGCNFACNGCYNYDHVTQDEPIANARSLIENLLTPMHEAVVFLGGEPTIWDRHLIEAVRFVKQKGLKTKVFSNGSIPSVVTALNAQKLVDAWSLDFKCVRDSERILGKRIQIDSYLEALRQSAKNIKKHGISLEFRTTLWSGVTEQLDEIKAYLQLHFPDVQHIVQRDFNENLRRASA